MSPAKARPGTLGRPAVSALLGISALWILVEIFGPRGFALRDEAWAVSVAQRFVSSGVWGPSWSCGSFLRLSIATALRWGGSWRWVHAPVLLAWIIQAWALHRLGKRLGGPLVAQGALLATALSAASLLQARSLLPFAVTPALLALSLELTFQGPRRAVMGGALLALALTEYEGAFLALPGLALFLVSETRLPKGRARAFLMGALLCLPGLLWLDRQNLQDWWQWRLAHNVPGAATDESSPFLLRLWQWIAGAEPNPYLGLWHHASFALWALPLVLLGLIQSLRRRLWLAVWVAGGLAGLLPAAFIFEPHRSIAAVPALALAAGFGWAALWRLIKPRPMLGLALMLLPILGFVWELRAFDHSMQQGAEDYRNSAAWIRAAASESGPLQSGVEPVGRAWEALWGPRRSGPLQVWLPLGFVPDAPPWPVRALLDAQGHPTGDLLAQVSAQDPTLPELAWLRQFWDRLPDTHAAAAEACRQALGRGGPQQRLARLALWDQLLYNAVLGQSLSQSDLDALAQERFQSVTLYRRAEVDAFDPRLRYALMHLQGQVCGEKSLNSNEKNFLKHPWDQLAGAPTWTRPGALTPAHPKL